MTARAGSPEAVRAHIRAMASLDKAKRRAGDAVDGDGRRNARRVLQRAEKREREAYVGTLFPWEKAAGVTA